MKKLLLSLLWVGATLCAYAQNQVVVSGRVIDNTNKTPLGYATIVVNAGDKVVFGCITDPNGRFVVKGLAGGEYTLNASFVGYGHTTTPFMVGRNNLLDLGNIELKSSSNSIDEVVVEGRRETVSASLDKKSYSMKENIAQASGSVLDAMRSMPGITVDQEGKVVLRGSDKVAILIDGQQSGMTGFGSQKGLDNIPAAAIERIEVINNPSAKYDASGMAGIINIIYKKESQSGLHGDLGFNYSIGNLTNRKNDLPTGLASFKNNSKYIPSLNLNYKNDKINIFLQSNMINQHRLPNNEFTTRTYDKDNADFSGKTIASQVA